ncbi:putative ATP synthase subunit E [Taphrina deformans PYCC 5710]|uniref:ATP synthase subunit E n=1 Tax=Taphrina deformans (strain PYCC 5710 / ATCC 11124 / CBS 356.35 / IMI 108563 / JCM 9778 / NBRC 8474) TaxID=1097556 RepID=R4XAV3_TAPDE|nr:putative ATP synthase subunit E [Taphrina deformans PYCC 5710]|eukprot:CCG81453.1 putative ATP synthase subunit E [Taphrina deformans PYCC 5710]
MNESQVQGEMRKMTAFIRQEALEKSKEIHIKADEEFAIEKAKLVRAEQAKIEEQYEAKTKKAGMSQQIAKSTVLNKQRLKVLAARQEVLDDIFEEARKQLSSISNDQAKYTNLVEQLLLQGFLKLMANEVSISAREADYDVVKKAFVKSTQDFKDKSGIEVKVSIDENDPLPKSLHGGVIVKTNQSKIRVNNTLEERLKLLQINALPLVRAALFGESQTRKFHD